MIGLKKGVMYCEGVGQNKKWTITYTTKTTSEVYDVWKIFHYILSDMHCWRHNLRVRMYIGDEHLFLRSRHNPGSGGITVDRFQIEQLLNCEDVTDTYVQKIGSCFDIFSKQMNGQHMRLYTDMTEFCLMSTKYFEYLKSIGQEKYVGLYSDNQGLCRLEFVRQRNICKIGKKSQCIFATILFEENEEGVSKKRYVCGKFSEKFAMQKIADHKTGRYKFRTIGTCESLRGFEI